jgi:hypothetical protein
MIWDDPWVQLAMLKGGPGRFCTTLPPPRTPLAAGQVFRCLRVSELDLNDWNELVGTRWTMEELALRLVDAWIPCLFDDGDIVATCVLRPKPALWILETLKARKGFGTPLLRAVIPWIYDTTGGPFVLGYTWELSGPGLLSAWWRGWLGSASPSGFQYGWSWTSSASSRDCGFCSSRWEPLGPRLALPTLFQDGSGSAIGTDPGLGDGWGHISVARGQPTWSTIAKKGGWRSLWMRSASCPGPDWVWTGEFVVVGLLNHNGSDPVVEWVTAEI